MDNIARPDIRSASIWLDPITDRTMEDVIYADANRDNAEPLKGALNASDLNRIAGNSAILRDLLINYGYAVPALKQRISWTKNDIPNVRDLQNVLDDVRMLKNQYPAFAHRPVPPAPLNHYEKMNDVERIIHDTEQLISWMIDSFHYANQFYSGEEVQIAQIRFAATGRFSMGELKQFTMLELNKRTMREIMFGW